MSLGRFEAAVRLCIEGRSSPAFTVRTVGLPGVTDPKAAATVRLASRRFARPVEVVDDELQAAVGSRGRPGPDEAGNGARP
jgi:hypothetical protein